MKRILVAFDFDHTLIADNSDTYVRRLAPNGGTIPQSISKLYSDSGWTAYMAAVFQYLHKNGTTPSQLLACVGEIPLVTGMEMLLRHMSSASDGLPVENSKLLASSQAHDDCELELHTKTECTGVNYDAIIISDSNSVFIDHILGVTGVKNVFSKVYTNPASFNSDGCLLLSPYHNQDWCELSTKNLCKGHILDTHRHASPVDYDLIAYVGDGANDLCPALRLRACDLVFPRRGYSLVKRIAEVNDKISAKIVPWETGFEILEALKEAVSNVSHSS